MKNKNTRKKSLSGKRKNEKATFLRSFTSGLLFASAVAILLLLAGTFPAYSANDPEIFAAPIGIASFLLCCAAGGFRAMKRRQDASGYASAILVATALNVISLTVSLIIPGKDASFPLSLILRLGAFGAAALGAFAGTVKRSAHRHR